MDKETKYVLFERVNGHCVNIGMFNSESAAKKKRAQIRGTGDRDIFVQEIQISVDNSED